MDIRTGQLYESKEAALEAGVPESDIAEIFKRRDGTYWPKFDNKKCPVPHQSMRERQRRVRQQEKSAI